MSTNLYTQFSDTELIKLIKSGDHAAYTQIFERYWAVLLQHGAKMLKNEEEAVDLVQDIFINLWVRHTELDIRVSISSYLYTSVRNRIISKIRHTKVHEGYLDSLTQLINHGELITDNQIRFRELAAQITKEVALLPPGQRNVFELSRNEGLSHAQIAELLHISDETVKKQIHKALKTLKIKLDAFLLTLL